MEEGNILVLITIIILHTLVEILFVMHRQPWLGDYCINSLPKPCYHNYMQKVF